MAPFTILILLVGAAGMASLGFGGGGEESFDGIAGTTGDDTLAGTTDADFFSRLCR